MSNAPKVNRETYEVNDEFDNARTFSVYKDGNLVGFGNENGSWALLQLAPSYSFGLKFDNIEISQGTEIKSAYIALYSIGTPINRYPNCKIYCDDTDNAVNFSKIGVLNISGRTYTENYTLWNDTVEFEKWTNTLSLVASIQEVIDRKNWVAGNSIAFLFVSEGYLDYSATFQNFENGYPAKLYVEWS
jgi:hypothetical protein